jgi:hypothetical protein
MQATYRQEELSKKTFPVFGDNGDKIPPFRGIRNLPVQEPNAFTPLYIEHL